MERKRGLSSPSGREGRFLYTDIDRQSHRCTVSGALSYVGSGRHVGAGGSRGEAPSWQNGITASFRGRAAAMQKKAYRAVSLDTARSPSEGARNKTYGDFLVREQRRQAAPPVSALFPAVARDAASPYAPPSTPICIGGRRRFKDGVLPVEAIAERLRQMQGSGVGRIPAGVKPFGKTGEDQPRRRRGPVPSGGDPPWCRFQSQFRRHTPCGRMRRTRARRRAVRQSRGRPVRSRRRRKIVRTGRGTRMRETSNGIFLCRFS